MNSILRLATVLLASLALVACTTTRLIAEGPRAAVDALREAPPALDASGMLVITTGDGQRLRLASYALEGDTLTGVVREGSPMQRIPLASITRVEVATLDTRALAIGAVVLLAVVALATRHAVDSMVRGIPGATP